MSATDELPGFDASRHQGELVPAGLAQSGMAFGFLKITDGIAYRYVDWFYRNANKVQAAGAVLGAYHFLLDQHPGDAQARFYVDQVQRRSGGFHGIVPIVDIEREQDGTTPGIGVLRQFVAEFRRLVPGREILIYTGRWYWVGVLKNPRGVDLGPLWHSEYDGLSPIDFDVANGPELEVYGGWTQCTVWQHTSSGIVPGVAGLCDRNLFYGTRAELEALAGSTTTPVEEDDVMTAVTIAVDGRDGAHYQVINFETATWLATGDDVWITGAYWAAHGVPGLAPDAWDTRDLDRVLKNPGSRPAPSWVGLTSPPPPPSE